MKNLISTEIWKPVRGFEAYEVSNQGNVRSWKILGNTKNPPSKPRILKLKIEENGYVRICFMKSGKRYDFLVHRLVLGSFLPNTDNKPEVNHKNGIKTDNRVENLEWCTREENLSHCFKSGKKRQGESHGKAVLTEEKVLEMRRVFDSQSMTYVNLSNKFNISANYARKIIKRKAWRHI